MNDKLESKSDAELNELFAVEILGRTISRDTGEPAMSVPEKTPGFDSWAPIPDFCSNFTLVKPFIENWRYADIEWNRITMLWTVSFQQGEYVASDMSLPRAAVVAMLYGKQGRRISPPMPIEASYYPSGNVRCIGARDEIIPEVRALAETPYRKRVEEIEKRMPFFDEFLYHGLITIHPNGTQEWKWKGVTIIVLERTDTGWTVKG